MRRRGKVKEKEVWVVLVLGYRQRELCMVSAAVNMCLSLPLRGEASHSQVSGQFTSVLYHLHTYMFVLCLLPQKCTDYNNPMFACTIITSRDNTLKHG